MLAFLHTYLNDPSHVRDAAVSQPQLKYIGPGDRYVACVRYNARNTDGKYQGSKDGAAIYVAGKLDRFLDTPKDVRELCKDVDFCVVPRIGEAHALAHPSAFARGQRKHAPAAGLKQLGGARFRQNGRK